jgi:hypothetical protein
MSIWRASLATGFACTFVEEDPALSGWAAQTTSRLLLVPIINYH